MSVLPVTIMVNYYRVSTDEQKKKGHSLPEQKAACHRKARELAEQRGTELQVYEFEDAASGEVLERAGLTACREFCQANRVHYFICLDPDRFARDLLQQLLVTDEIEKRGTQLVFIQHNYEKTPEGQLFYQMRGAISQFEKAKIKERSTRGRRGKLAAGGIPNRIEPWGYKWDLQAKTLRIDREAEPWVRQVFEWYAEGWSYQRIVEKLQELGVPPQRGQAWYRTVISRVVQNSVYSGRLIINRWDCDGLGPLKSIPKEKRTRPISNKLKPQEEWVTVAVPAIISEELWERCQALHKDRTRLMQRGVGLLSGLCVCGLCGDKVHYMGDPRHRYLRCVGRYPHLRDSPTLRYKEPCPWTDVKATGIERGIWRRVEEWLLGDDDALAKEKARRQDRTTQTDDVARRLAALERDLAAKQEEHRRMFYLAARGLAPAGIEKDLEAVAAQVKALDVELAGLKSRAHRQQQEDQKATAGLQEIRAEVKDRLHLFDLAQRQRVVRFLISRVVVWPDGRFEYDLK